MNSKKRRHRTAEKKTLQKGISLLLCTALAAGLVSCGQNGGASETGASGSDAVSMEEKVLESALGQQVSASHSKNAGKEETVYVLADARGAVSRIIVSDWIKNADGSGSLKDATDLKDIQNVKGYETFVEGEDGSLTWETDGTDIYYQGTTDKQLPVAVKLSYTLDGKEIGPEELAGKSGHVTIRFDYENRQKQTVTVNGKEEEIFIPFAMISGMVLPEETFSNIEVTNARLISEGNNSLVVGVAFPGLKDSLDVEGLKEKIEDKEKQEEFDKLEIPDYIEVSADATDFALNMTMTMAMSDVLSDISLTDSIDLDDISDSMDDLKSATADLKDGTVRLKDGTEELLDGTGRLKDGSSELSDGTVELLNGADTLKSGTKELNDKSGDLDKGAGELKNGAGELDTGADRLKKGAGDLKEGTKTLTAGTKELAAGSVQLDAGAAQLEQGLTTVDAAIAGLVAACEGNGTQTGLLQGTQSLSDGVAGLDQLINTYFNTFESAMMTQIAQAQTQLAQAKSTLAAAEQELAAAEAQKDAAFAALNEACVPAALPVAAAAPEAMRQPEEDDSDTFQTVSGNTVSQNRDQTVSSSVPASAPAANVISPERVQAAAADYQSAAEAVSVCSAEAAQARAQVDSAQEMVNAIQQMTAAYMGTSAFAPGSSDPAAVKQSTAAASKAATITMIKETSNRLAAGAKTVDAGVGQMYGYLAQLHDEKTGVPALAAGAKQLKQGTGAAVEGTKTLDAGAAKLDAGVDTLQAGTKDLKDGTVKLKDGTGELKDGTAKLMTGTKELDDGADTLRDGASRLHDGAKELSDGVQELSDGAKELSDGALELKDGMFRFDEEGISKLTDLFGDNVEEALDRIQAVMDAGKDYTTFTRLPEGTDGSVRFIYKTDEVKADR